MSQQDFNQLVRDASARVKQARGQDAEWAAGTLEASDYWLDQTLAGLPQDAPPFVAPLDPGAIYGRTKWYPGLGCDLFTWQGSGVYAPQAATVREVVGGTGLSGGAEIILATPGNAWAWRYRHVYATVTVGQAVDQGALVAYVYDPSLDQLGRCPLATPSGWQHLDLSVNQGTDRFAPTGGGGGNVSAYQWLQSVGYVGTVVDRTPGPPDAGH